MLGQIDIINNALRHIGHSPIVSMTDTSPQSRASKAAWDSGFNEFLADHAWTFATGWADLRRITDLRNKPWEYEYFYALPIGFERIISIKDFTNFDVYEITLIEDYKVFACNKEAVSLKYIRNDFSLSNMSSPAKTALMFRIALHLDRILNDGTGFETIGGMMSELTMRAVTYEATAHNKRQLNPTPLVEIRNG